MAVFASNNVSSQSEPSQPKNAETYLQILANSKDSLYSQILEEFDNYLEQDSNNFSIRIEKCKVVEKAYYDSYEDYNPKYEEFEICLEDLASDFPQHPEVLLYKLDYIYGDSAISFGNKIIDENKLNASKWSKQQLALVYNRLAREYSYKEEPYTVIKYAETAQRLNDTLDLSLLLAQQYVTLNFYQKAKSLLISSLDSTDLAWETNQKGNLLLKLGMAEEALTAFNYAQRDTNSWVDNGQVANSLIDIGKFKEAREFLIKDLQSSFDRSLSLHKLFKYDYKYSLADTALVTYKKLNQEDFLNDAFGFYRLKMIFLTPFSGWSSWDAAKFFLLVLVVFLLLVLPYLWILPIHFLSGRFGIYAKTRSLIGARWGLRDFWLISSAVLILQFLTWGIFDYENLVMSLFSEYYSVEKASISLMNANETIFFFLCMLVAVLLFLRKNDYRFVKKVKWSYAKGIGLGVGAAIMLRFVYGIMVKLELLPGHNPSATASIMDAIASINSYYHPLIGFLFIVLIVPFYEEYLFRAIALNAIEERLKFIAANVLQSLFFALLHEDISLFIFYFSFGLIAGYLVRRSNSLAPSLAFHITNNLIAFIALMSIYEL